MINQHKYTILAITLCTMVITCGTILGSTDESSAVTDGNWTFTVNPDNTTATITKYTGSASSGYAIPSSVSNGGNTYSVTRVGGEGPVIDPSLTAGATLTLPNTLTEIGPSAFTSWAGSGVLTIPDSVTTIGTYSFAYSQFTSLNLPANLATIGDDAFSDCHLEGTVEIPQTVTSLGYESFARCSEITAIVLHEGLTAIGGASFYECTGLTGTLEIPSTVQTIGGDAFFSTSITSLVLHEGLEVIEYTAFQMCENLTGTLIIPSTVTSVDTYCFAGSKFVGMVNLSDATFADDAFAECTFTEVLNLGNVEMAGGMYGLPADIKVRNTIDSDVMVQLKDDTTTETVTKEGTIYTLIGIIPIMCVLAVVLYALHILGITRRFRGESA